MEFRNNGYSYFYMAALFSGLLHQCASQEQNVCSQVTVRSDFKEFEHNCYWVSGLGDIRTWDKAQSICRTYGGNLATVSTKETLEFLTLNWSQILDAPYWIGLYLNESVTSEEPDTLEERRKANWKWIDGTKYEQQSNIGWSEGEPTNKKESLVRLRYGKTWASIEGTIIKYPYICQTKISSSTTSTLSTTSTPSTTSTSTTTSSKPDVSERVSTQNPDHSTLGPNSSCEGNWMYSDTTSLCYILKISEVAISWTDAEEQCKSLGGQLASLSTQEQHDAAVTILRGKEVYNQDVWIGLMYEEGASVWKWTDGSPYMFQKWAANEPSPGEKYGRLKEGEWRAIYNDYYHNSLCQKEPMKSMSTDVPGSTPMQNEDPSITDRMGVSGGPSETDKSRILGPVLGVLGGATIMTFVGLVIFMKRHRETQFNALMHRLRIDQWFKKSTKPEEPYSDIKDEDLDKHHVYYNETGDRGPQSRNSSLGNETTISPASVQQVPSDAPIDDLYELSLKPEHEYTPLQRIHRRTE